MSESAAIPVTDTAPATADDVVALLVKEQEAADAGTAQAEPESPTPSDATDLSETNETPVEPTYTVKVRGEDRQVTLNELQKGYSRTEDYHAKSAEVAEQRRAAERTQAEFASRAQQLDSLLQRAPFDDVLARGQKTDWATLARDNPAGYVAEKQEYEDRLQYWRQVSQHADQSRTQATQQRLVEGERQMREAVPEWADEGKRKDLQAGIAKTLESYGFSADDYAQVSDHRVLLVARDAMLYRQMQSERKAAEGKKVAPAPPRTMAPGTTQPNRSSQQVRASLKSAAKSGRTDDQVNAILAALES